MGGLCFQVLGSLGVLGVFGVSVFKTPSIKCEHASRQLKITWKQHQLNVCFNFFISSNFLLRTPVFHCPFPRCSTVAMILWVVDEVKIYLIIWMWKLRLTVFLPDRAIAGIPRCIKRRPPEKWRKGQFSPYFYKAACTLNPGILF